MQTNPTYQAIQALLESAIGELAGQNKTLTEQDNRIWRCLNKAIAACNPPVKKSGSKTKEQPITPVKTDRVDDGYKPENDWARK